MALKGLSTIAEGLFTLINFKQFSLSIQRSIKWYADTDFGIVSQWLALFKGGFTRSFCAQIYDIKSSFANLCKKNLQILS
jgi:hypothetical protein